MINEIRFIRVIDADISEAEKLVEDYQNGWNFVMKLLMGTHDGTAEKHKIRNNLMGSVAVPSDSEADEDNADIVEYPDMLSNDVLRLPERTLG